MEIENSFNSIIQYQIFLIKINVTLDGIRQVKQQGQQNSGNEKNQEKQIKEFKKQIIYTKMQNQNENKVNDAWWLKKSSLCRIYLRGNCPNSKEQCLYAHGIKDLIFKKYDHDQQSEMKPIYYDFRHRHPINQLDVEISERDKNYINLYEFQAQLSKKIKEIKNKKREMNKKPQRDEQKSESQKKQEQEQMKEEQTIGKKKAEKKRHDYDHYKKKQPLISNEENKMTQVYNPSKYYSLQQINKNRNLKIQIRKKFQQNQFRLFLELISISYHPQNQLNGSQREYMYLHEILQLEYFRVGFNKLMTRIKLDFLIDFLIFEYKGGHFKFSSLMPPLRNRPITYYIKMAPQSEVFAHYKLAYQKLKQKLDEEKKKIREQDVKQAMIRSLRDWWKIPPIVQLLRIKHCTFKDFFIRYILQDKQNINLEWVTDQSILLSQIHGIIEDQVESKQYCIVSTDILSKSPKFNRSLVQKCVQNQRKQQESLEKKQKKEKKEDGKGQNSQKLILIKCPNIKKQIITKQRYLKPEAKFDHQFGINLQVLIEDILRLVLDKNSDSKQQNLLNQELIQNRQKEKQPYLNQKIYQKVPDILEQYKIIEISKAAQFLIELKQILKNSTLLGIDLQGSLVDDQGFLSLIQINHYSKKILYLIDYLAITHQQSQEELNQCKKLLIKIFNHNDIVKIIHDSRNDAQCLYNLLGKDKNKEITHSKQAFFNQNVIKFTNIFDTAACEQVIRQFEDYNHYKANTPGLNEVLEKYGQNPNKHKQKFHSIWAQGTSDPSVIRPMSQQFKQYCLMDVLGLPKLYAAMSGRVNTYFLVLISQMHAQWSKNKEVKQQEPNQIIN